MCVCVCVCVHARTHARVIMMILTKGSKGCSKKVQSKHIVSSLISLFQKFVSCASYFKPWKVFSL